MIDRDLFEAVVNRMLDEIEDLTRDRDGLRKDRQQLTNENVQLEDQNYRLEQQQLQTLAEAAEAKEPGS